MTMNNSRPLRVTKDFDELIRELALENNTSLIATSQKLAEQRNKLKELIK